MKLHFSFDTKNYECAENKYLGIIEHIKKYGVNHLWNSCSYFGTEILISNYCFIPEYTYRSKIFYDIIFEEDPKNVFIEVKNDSDPEMIDGISIKGIKIFNNFNDLDFDTIRLNKHKRPNIIDIFIDPENLENEIYGFCVDKINFEQILEINIMYYNDKYCDNNDIDLEIIKTIYKKGIG